MSSPAQPRLDQTTRAEINRFVADVEKALGDLPPDDVSELTDGLEADLTEAWVAEGTTPTQRFGSPQAYAGDLRSAAGLPPRSGQLPRQMLAWRNQVAEVRDRMLELPGGPILVGWAKELQPAWWVLRGPLMLTLLLPAVVSLPGDATLTLVVCSLALAVVSLRWRSAAAAEGRRQVLLHVWNVLAVVGLLFGGSIFSSYYLTRDEALSWLDRGPHTNGLLSGDQQVTNVFAYDESGQPLTRIRLYDQDGTPLTVGDWRETTDAADMYLQTKPDSGDGPAEWNVFPLLGQPAYPDPSPGQTYSPPVAITPPYRAVPALPKSLVAQTQPSAAAEPSPHSSPEPDNGKDG